MRMAAVLFNVTIDDEAGDEMTGDKPTYTPSGSSGNWEQGATCSKCVAKPDPSEAFGGTWHDTTHNPRDPFQRAIEISFTGTAVYAFFICANTVEHATTLTNLTFALDGGRAGTFIHKPKATTDYEYNVLGYANSSIPDGQHQLLIQTTGDVHASLILFDYMIYSLKTNQVITTSQSTSTFPITIISTSPSTAVTQSKDNVGYVNTGWIIGIVVGSIAAVAIVALVFTCWHRRRERGGSVSGRRKRATKDLCEDGIVYDVVPTIPHPPSQSNSANLIYSGPSKAESQHLIPTSERPNPPYSTNKSLNSTLLAVQSSDGLSRRGSFVNSASVDPRVIRKEARQRQTEIVRQVVEMQQRVAVLRSQSATSGSVGGRGETSTDSIAGMSSENEAELRDQIVALQAEVDRLQSQREYFQQLGWGDEPPPEYVEDDGMDNVIPRQ